MPKLPDLEIRDFLQVYGQGGQACAVCGRKISEVTPNRRKTSFCRGCQGEQKLIGTNKLIEKGLRRT